MLTGLLFDETGDRLTPSHANKQGSRYRYYVARRLVEENAGDPTGWRLPATEIERVVISALLDWLKTPRELMDVIGNQYLATTNLTHFLKSSRQLSDTIQKSSTRERRKLIIPLVARVTIGNGGLTIRLCHDAMLKAIDITSGEGLTDSSVSDYHEILIPFSLRRRGVEARLIVGGGQPNQAVDPVLVPALATAHAWFHQLASGNVASINGIAREQGLAANEISRILPLAFLAPDIVEAIIAGKQPPELTAKQLKRFDCMPLDWQQQRQILGFPSSSNR